MKKIMHNLCCAILTISQYLVDIIIKQNLINLNNNSKKYFDFYFQFIFPQKLEIFQRILSLIASYDIKNANINDIYTNTSFMYSQKYPVSFNCVIIFH